MKIVLYKDFRLIKENTNLKVSIIALLLWYTQFLLLWYLCWKFFLYFIIFKSFFFFFKDQSKPQKEYRFEADLNLLKTLDYATTKAALNIINSLRKIKIEKKRAFIFLLVAFFRILIIFFLGYSLRFIYLTLLLTNKQLTSLNYLKFKSPFTFIRGFFYFLRKNLITILGDEYIYNIM